MRFLALFVVVAAERAQEAQTKLPEPEKVRRMIEGRYVYCSDIWDLKESLGLPMRKVERNTWASTPLSDLEF